MIKVETTPGIENLVAAMRQLSEQEQRALAGLYCRIANSKHLSKNSTII
jgi:hypothetical protein